MSPGSAFQTTISPASVFGFDEFLAEASTLVAAPPLSKPLQGLDLHALITEGEWKQLRKALERMHEEASEEDLAEVFGRRNSEGETPLHTAAWKASTKIVVQMLNLVPEYDRDHYVLAVDHFGNTPLHLACANLVRGGDVQRIKNLVRLGPEALEMPNQHGDTPMHLLMMSSALQRADDFKAEAVAEDLVDSLFKLCRSGLLGNQSGATLLHVSIALSTYERVQHRLLELEPAAAKVVDHHGLLPIHYVAAFGTPWTVAERLLEIYPASINCTTKDGDTPLHLLMSNSHKFLKPDGKFVDRNTTKIAELLVGDGSSKSPVLTKNKDQLNPLHAAALFNVPVQLTKIQMDSAGGKMASLDPSASGATALHLACASRVGKKAVENVQTLCSREACAMQDCKGRTPLVVAVKNHKVSRKTVKCLVKQYPEAANQASSNGHLPLHYAVQSKKAKESIVKTLLKAHPEGAKAVTNKGNTPLHEACKHRAPCEVVKMLVEKNPSAKDVPNKNHELPIDRARAKSAPKKVLALLGGSVGTSVRPTHLTMTPSLREF